MSDKKPEIAPENYHFLLNEVADLVQNDRIQAVQSVQTISNQLYWNIGELIIKKQEEFGWGDLIVKQLSQDLPELIGEGISWSPRNLWLMRQFYIEYSKVNQAGSLSLNVKQTASHLELLNENSKVKQPVSLLESINVKQPVSLLDYAKKLIFNVGWGQNILIFQKVQDLTARIFYLEQTIKNRYSRSVLLHQIKANAYEYYLTKPI